MFTNLHCYTELAQKLMLTCMDLLKYDLYEHSCGCKNCDYSLLLWKFPKPVMARLLITLYSQCHPYVADITVEKPFFTVDAFSSYPLPLQCGKYLAINKSFYFQVKSFTHPLLKLYFYKCNVCKSFHSQHFPPPPHSYSFDF